MLIAALQLAIANPVFADYEWVPRPDAMHWHRLADFDQLDGRVRVLYYTLPSLEQSRSPDKSINVYITELHTNGRIETRQLASGQRHFADLLLQRGGDGVFAVVQPDEGGGMNALEYWSAEDGTLLATSSPAALKSAVHGVFPTDDGNLYTATQSAQSSRGDRPTTITLTKLSPQGDVIATASWSDPTATTIPGGAFIMPGGGMGVSLNMRVVRGAEALNTDAQAIQQYEIAGRSIEAKVFAETRLLAIDAAGEVLWQSPALERDLGWDGEMAVPQDLPVDAMMAQNNEQMALMARVRLENGADRNVEHLATVGLDDIQKSPNGWGMLARVSANRRLDPPHHGVWYLEVGSDGSLQRELRIEPAAERLDAKFERFMPTADGGLLVAGVRRGDGHHLHLSALDQEGHVEWTARLGMKDVKIEGIAGSKSLPWVFGHGFNEAGNKNLMWAELVQASAMKAADAQPVAAQPSPSSQKPATGSSAVPTFEMPEAAQGCTCTCEEFAAIQELTESMKSASQADVMAMISKPGYQQLMQCMGSCAMRYTQCR